MSIVAGQHLANYEILESLGCGGMGEVWLARDRDLDRDVAIKVIPDELADDAERLRRFEREAKTLASLNHPNIGGIHGVGNDGSVTFLSLELVPGADLAARIESGPMPLDEVIDFGRQIAEGLEAAHEAGVVHRDLKPANIRVTPDGVVKILDFGLAKRFSGTSGPDQVSISADGAVVGTPTYMSPEAVRGKPVDRRADIWGFGCVLFECLTGKLAFSGASIAEVLSAVIEHEWDRSALPAVTPARLRELLERCLDKDPRQRLRDIGEARVVLSAQLDDAPTLTATGSKPVVRFAPLLVLALVAGVVAGRLTLPLDETEPIRQHRLSEMDGIEEMPAISPGGTLVAFVARGDRSSQIFVRALAGGIPRQITTATAHHAFPRWIDDDTLIYLRSDRCGGPGTMYESVVMSASQPKPVASAEGEADVSPDGRRLATFRRDDEGPMLVLLDRRGEEPEQTRRLPEGTYGTPRFSPDGRSLAFDVKPYLISAELRVMDLETGKHRKLVSTNNTRGLAWLPDGSGLVYASSRGSTLPYPPVFKLRRIEIDGSGDVLLPFGGAGYASYEQPDISDNGKLVACRLQLATDIYRYPVDETAQENTAREEPITRQTGLVQVPSVSPSGDQIVYLSDTGGHANLWVVKRDGSLPPRPITDERDPNTSIAIPVWSPKDDQIAYVQATAGQDPEVWLVDSEGRKRRLLVRGAVGPSWSADGEWVYYGEVVGAASANPTTWRISTKTGKKERVRDRAVGMVVTADGKTCFFTRSAIGAGAIHRASPIDAVATTTLNKEVGMRVPMTPHQYVLSPDGAWLAGPLKDGDTTNLYRISTTDGSLHPVTDFGPRRTMIARQVSWGPDGKYLYAAVMEIDADVVLLEVALNR